MAKKIISLIFIGIISLSLLCGCSDTIKLEDVTETKTGKYEMYYTASDEEYLRFINDLDEEKYEIFDISHSRTCWYVTYKVK